VFKQDLGPAVAVGAGSVEVAIQEQALETREATSPSHPATAYVGIGAVAVMVCVVKFAQKDCAASRRPGTLVARKARRQLSALQALPVARGIRNARRIGAK
jgi:hypothetical protein